MNAKRLVHWPAGAILNTLSNTGSPRLVGSFWRLSRMKPATDQSLYENAVPLPGIG
jgi:hypothetical protein